MLTSVHSSPQLLPGVTGCSAHLEGGYNLHLLFERRQSDGEETFAQTNIFSCYMPLPHEMNKSQASNGIFQLADMGVSAQHLLDNLIDIHLQQTRWTRVCLTF